VGQRLLCTTTRRKRQGSQGFVLRKIAFQGQTDNVTDFNTWNRGYERLGSQILEQGTNPDLKEGYFIGEEISTDHPYFIGKKLNSGPNLWPETMSGVDDFRATSMEYYTQMHVLARDVLAVIAQTLDLKDDYFAEFTNGAVATLRYLHYPPQPADSDEKLARGIGAHTDFGSVTLLMQGDVDGLQVYDKDTNEWLDVCLSIIETRLCMTNDFSGCTYQRSLCCQLGQHVHAMVS